MNWRAAASERAAEPAYRGNGTRHHRIAVSGSRATRWYSHHYQAVGRPWLWLAPTRCGRRYVGRLPELLYLLATALTTPAAVHHRRSPRRPGGGRTGRR